VYWEANLKRIKGTNINFTDQISMPNIELEILKLLEDPLDGYTNLFDVQITANLKIQHDRVLRSTLQSISVTGYYPGYDNQQKEISLEVYADFKTILDFINRYKIVEVMDLEFITPELLLQHYQEGKGAVFCSVDSNYLYFRIENDAMFVSDYSKPERKIDKLLVGVEEFIEYTRKTSYLP